MLGFGHRRETTKTAGVAESSATIGDRMPDGTAYAGISPDTGKAMYTRPKDEPLTLAFSEAQKCAAKLDAHGHQDWRVPTMGELNMLYNNRAAIGGFDESGSDAAGWYWSSSKYIYNMDCSMAWAQRFSEGSQTHDYRYKDLSLRCVR